MPKFLRHQAAPRLYTILAWLCFAELMILFAFLYVRSIRTSYFQIDEFEFVRKGFFYELLLRHETRNPQWLASENDPAQPKVGPYIYGAVLHAVGYRNIASYFTRYDNYKAGKTDQWQLWLWKDAAHLPKEVTSALPLVLLGRRVSMVFTLAMFCILFWVSRLAGGYLYGLIVLYLLGFNPLLRAQGVYAMTDTFLLFFFSVGLLAALIFVRTIQRQTHRLLYILSVLMGILYALSAGVKVTGIILIGFGLIGAALLFLLPHSAVRSKFPLLVCAVIMTVTFLFTFIALHPFLYHKTMPRLRFMFTSRLESANVYQKKYPSSAVITRAQALELVIRKTLLPGWHGNFSLIGIPIDLFLFLTGVFFMVKTIYNSYRLTHRIAGESVLFLWTIIVLVSIVAYLRNDWARYYMPSVVVVTLVQAYAVTAFLRPIRKLLVF